MRVALNLLYLLPGVVGGTETYAASLVEALAAEEPNHELLLFTNREAAGRFPALPANVSQVVCGVWAASRARRYAYEQGVLPAKVRAARADVLHSLGYVGPLRAPCPHVVTVPDLNYLGHGPAMPSMKRRVLGAFVRGSVARADHVITISEFSRAQIVERLGVDPAHVTVTHLAGRPLPPGDGGVLPRDGARVAERYGVRGPYVVAFASGSPHKNIGRLVDAFAMLGARVAHTLVLVGHLPPTLLAAAPPSGGRVVATGYVPDADVLPLLSGADLFVFPSLYEGFGLPLLDAQGCGVPVASSSAGSLPEVAGEGAVLFDPTSVPAMADAMWSLLSDRALAARLREAGRANVARFTWAGTARQTQAVYRGVVRPQ